MTMRTALLGAFLSIGTFGGCDGSSMIGNDEPRIAAPVDPDANLPAAMVQITNTSAGTLVPGISTYAGVPNVLLGEFLARAFGRTTQTTRMEVCASGSVGIEDIRNLRLYTVAKDSGQADQIGSTIERLTSSCAAFSFVSPTVQQAGETVTYRLGADVFSGVNRYLQFGLINPASITVRDRAGHDANITLNMGSWPMLMSRITIASGNLVARSDDQFVQTSIPTTEERTDTMASILLTAYGEGVRVTGLDVNLTFLNGLLPSDLTDLKVVDDLGQQLGTTQSTVGMANPSASYGNLNYVIPANAVGREWIQAKFRAGAKGTVLACLNVTGAQGFTSLANLVAYPACGTLMTVGE